MSKTMTVGGTVKIPRGLNTFALTALAAMMLFTVACAKKKVAVAPPPAPPPAAEPAPPPPPPPAAPRINAFGIEPRSIQQGQSAQLTWSAANATEISIDPGIGMVAANGSRLVNPNQTTTYTLTARGPGGTDTRSVTIEVTNPPPPPPPPPPPAKVNYRDIFTSEVQGAGDAYFDYDKSDLRADAQQVLTRAAAGIKRILEIEPNAKFVLEGHCDERGSAEYNLGLGDRRATSGKEFLISLGVPADKINNISLGKEKPICTDASEACYQRNRRVHLEMP